MKKLVKDLNVGDILKGSNYLIVEAPFDSVNCPKGKVNLGIKTVLGAKIVQWNKNTEIVIL